MFSYNVWSDPKSIKKDEFLTKKFAEQLAVLCKNKFHKRAGWGSFVKTTQRVRLSTSTINQEGSGFHASDAIEDS